MNKPYATIDLKYENNTNDEPLLDKTFDQSYFDKKLKENKEKQKEIKKRHKSVI